VTSDGITVVKESALLSGVEVYDGKPCKAKRKFFESAYWVHMFHEICCFNILLTTIVSMDVIYILIVRRLQLCVTVTNRNKISQKNILSFYLFSNSFLKKF